MTTITRDENGIYEPDAALVRQLAEQIVKEYGLDPTTVDIAEVVEGGDGWDGREQLEDGDFEVLIDEVRDLIASAEMTIAWK